MRLCMMGTGPFAVPTFLSLLDSDHEVVALVTRPSVVARTHGKDKTPPNPMRQVAESRGVPILDPASVNDASFQEVLRSLHADLLVVCDYGQILSSQSLEAAPLGGINLHGSLLPKYRGAAPIQWALWNGDTTTGVTVIHMTPRLDAGPILVQRSVAIDPNETGVELEPRLAQLGAEAVREALSLLQSWDRHSPLGSVQDPQQATRAPRLKKTDGQVDWSQSAKQIFDQYRAVQPWPGLYSNFLREGKPPVRMILDRLERGSTRGDLGPGELAWDERLLVGTGNGSLVIRRLQPAGKRVMEAAEFLRGTPLHPGDRLG